MQQSLLVLYFLLLISKLIVTDHPNPEDTTYAALRSVSSESDESEDRIEGKSLIGAIGTVKKVIDIIQRVGSKVSLKSESAIPSSKEFGRPIMRAIDAIHNIKKGVEDFAKIKSL